jgi:hypothetical protein
MCGAPKTQEVITRAEIDPALQRLLYGGTAADPRGGFGSRNQAAGGGSAPMMDGGMGGGMGGGGGDSYDAYSGGGSFASSGVRAALPGGVNDPRLESGFSQGVARAFDAPRSAPTAASRPSERPSGFGISYEGGRPQTVRMAMGGPVMPQQGLASLNQGQMPMMNGGLPNLSDPMTAATLAMAMRGPQMQYGDIMAPQMPQQRFAMGGMIEGPGTGTSDSIDAVIMQNGQPVQQALLSDGEFVMTERAVRGAGNGDRDQGAARMYEMMRQFERGGRV